MKVYRNLYSQIISLDNLFLAWTEFKHGKQAKADVMKFDFDLEANIFGLHNDLVSGNYRHGRYHRFYITYPKQRLIHKASVRDRVLHHSVFNTLNPIFEETFIADSYSCRIGKGTHRGVKKLALMLRQVSKNNTQACFALKCDVAKFFACVDHIVLLDILGRRIKDEQTVALLRQIIRGFRGSKGASKGLPIGNLTSQLFANVYMNEFDQFVKHQLKVKYYLRYTDDFIIAANRKEELKELLPALQEFLACVLKLVLHPQKVTISKYISGVDFLGYVIFPHHIRLRTKTKRRVMKRVCERNLSSYLGVCSHANAYGLHKKIKYKIEHS